MQEFCCKQKNHIMHIQVLIKMDDITNLKTESNIGQNEKQLQTLRVKSTLSLSLSLRNFIVVDKKSYYTLPTPSSNENR